MNPEEIISQLRDIRPAVEIPVPAESMSVMGISLLTIAVLAVVGGIAWWWKRRRRKPDLKRSALDELLAIRELLGTADSEAFAVAVSDVLRRYIESQFGAAAVRQTSEEFLAGLAAADDSPIRPYRDALRQFLRDCDIVKFARGTLDSGQRESLHNSAREFIEATCNPPSLEVIKAPACAAPAAA